MAKDTTKGIPDNMTTEAEFDLIDGFLKAVEFKTDEENIKKIEIRRKGKLFFTFRIHPLAEKDLQMAKKRATTYMPNPAGKQYPPIEKSTSKSVYNSYLIYLATVEEDRAKLWDNKDLLKKLGAMQGYELVDAALMAGEKDMVIDVIEEISGYGADTFGGENEDGNSDNEKVDEVEFAGN